MTDGNSVPEPCASDRHLSDLLRHVAHALELNVVAEGVETQEQHSVLCALSCDEMQGFLFSKPLPAATFERRHLLLRPDTLLCPSAV
jgi:EAL domain-containing protein (putative c-di-GMP-specific phosphodiesterase class I)